MGFILIFVWRELIMAPAYVGKDGIGMEGKLTYREYLAYIEYLEK